MNRLKATTKITCITCGCTLNRTKTIKVIAKGRKSAIIEANQKIKEWKKSLKGQNCKICQSVIDDLEKYIKKLHSGY